MARPALAYTPTPGAQPGDTVQVAVVGCGNWGKNYLRVLQELDRCQVAACVDIDSASAQAAAAQSPGARCATEDELVASEQAEAAIVATPASSHYAITKHLLSAGKHVLVEKPFALSAQQAEELVRLAEDRQRVLMVGHIMLYHPAIVRLREYLTLGELGHIYYVYTNRTSLGLVRHDVNVMWDLAVHDIAVLHYLLGVSPQSVRAVGRCYIAANNEDVVFLSLDFPDGVMANVHVSWLDPAKIRRTTIIGDQKMAVFDDVSPTEKIRIYNKNISLVRPEDVRYADFGQYQLIYRHGDVLIPEIQLSEPLKNQTAHFLHCVRNGSEPLTSGREALAVIRVLEAAQQSLRSGGVSAQVLGNG